KEGVTPTGFKKIVDTEIVEDPDDAEPEDEAPASDPEPAAVSHKHKHHAGGGGAMAEIVYTFPVGLGRFDWKTPVGAFHVTAKVKDPTWVVPDDIYKEHLERDGEAEHIVPGGDDDNPL